MIMFFLSAQSPQFHLIEVQLWSGMTMQGPGHSSINYALLKLSTLQSSLLLTLNPFTPDLNSNSHYRLQYNSYNISLENLVLDQLIIPWLIFLLITTVLDFVLMLLGEILSWSLMGVKEDEALPPSLHVWADGKQGLGTGKPA